MVQRGLTLQPNSNTFNPAFSNMAYTYRTGKNAPACQKYHPASGEMTCPLAIFSIIYFLIPRVSLLQGLLAVPRSRLENSKVTKILLTISPGKPPSVSQKKNKKKTLNVFFCRATQNSNFVFFLCGLTAMFLNTCVVRLHLFLLFSYR